jgi:hypothetical protein
MQKASRLSPALLSKKKITCKSICNSNGTTDVHETETENDGNRIVVCREAVEKPSRKVVTIKRVVRRIVRRYVHKPNSTEDIVKRGEECSNNEPAGKVETYNKNENWTVTVTLVKHVRQHQRKKDGTTTTVQESIEDGDFIPCEAQVEEKTDLKDCRVVEK